MYLRFDLRVEHAHRRLGPVLNEVGYVRKCDDFVAAHYVFDVTQGRALCGGQTAELGGERRHGVSAYLEPSKWNTPRKTSTPVQIRPSTSPPNVSARLAVLAYL
jgi:hypothetical protein